MTTNSVLRRVVPLVAAVALVGHIGWWYWPRLHRGEPRGGPAELLTAPGLDDAVWIAHPHQNLARLESDAGRIDELAGHVATLLGGEPPAWPRFVFWPVPPARSLAWGRSADRASELLAIQPYPVVGWLLRAAGVIAGNPWLAGGRVGDDATGERVRWEEGTWIFERGAIVPSPDSRNRPRVPVPEAALAWVRVGDGHAPWPAGLYRVRALPDGVELVTGPPVASPAAAAVRRLRERSVLIAFAAPDDGEGAMALVRPSGSSTGLQLPGAVLVERGESGLELPGARLLAAIGVEPRERAAGPFRIRAWDRGSLDLGSELVRELRAADRAGELPRLAAWTDLDQVAAWAQTLGDALRVVPFIDPGPARRWLAFAALARAAGPGAALWAEVDASRGAARIALRHRRAAD